ncbi:LLM class flavin-dependent oxidoreductase [Moraxella bovis]|uniref:LLM class flavin-dependent oxidoreductase n=1 Tax=Moraxella bovis TaxID=476 RepID=UPI001ABF206D|nr:LLM class flavin-dependent oxidoreductase [Moraxella bovis]UYZ74719.1 LLM class flavin-dependent oxidoreductase [Moraxella bovis]UYZ80050.1 LLM class flavin-dependent oxidoreductase [Moraxella bovis]UYZ94248.1 LLM class flavin-dependent oxidoreductase [Moraxella bovis]UYZ96816.1 LLM class flavin-dependent oxidoreductase [Moraxella bovis]UYZ99499.1 LLM class flavin-dependent oxidoreductase [Moraxella bovis]
MEIAKTAEQAKIHTLFIADTPAMVGAGVIGDFAQKSPMFVLEPMTILSAVATHTQKIGLVATYSTTYIQFALQFGSPIKNAGHHQWWACGLECRYHRHKRSGLQF